MDNIQMEAIEALARYITMHRTDANPYRLYICIHKVGNQGTSRYMRVYVCEGVEVTNFVATILGYKISNAKDTYGCMIVHGCGMDMCFHVVNTLASIVNPIYQNLINGDYYNYVEAGKRRR